MEQILKEAALGYMNSIIKIAMIVIPLMICIEMLKTTDLLQKATRLFHPVTRLLGLPSATTFPLLAGIIFGVAYGSGLIIQSVETGEISPKENYLLNIFLSICHGMIEDTLLFVAIGASLGVLVAVRIAAAVLITRLFAFYINRPTSSQSINV